MSTIKKVCLLPIMALALAGCGSDSYEFDSDWHISEERVAEEAPKAPSGIPDLVGNTATLPEIVYEGPSEVYDIVLENVDLRIVLNELADSAQLNMDIDPFVGGVISLNAYRQTVNQILERIKVQVPLRFETIGDTVIILRDQPYFKQYTVDFPNIERTWSSSSDSGLSSSGSASLGSSSISTSQSGTGSFWSTLEEAASAILQAQLNEEVGSLSGEAALDRSTTDASGRELTRTFSSFIHSMPEAGLLIVFADALQHEQISQLMHTFSSAAKRQVQLQATVVEVSLNNDYNQGIDWSLFNPDSNSPKLVQTGAGSALFGSILSSGTANDPTASNNVASGESFIKFFNDTAINTTDTSNDELAAAYLNWANRNGVSEDVRIRTTSKLLSGGASNVELTDEDYQTARLYDQTLRREGTTPRNTGFLTGTFQFGSLQAAVDLLDKFGDTRVVSSPRVSTLNGQGALLKVVEDRVYFSLSQTSTVQDGVSSIATTVEEETIPVGFSLNVFPQVSADGTIILVMRPSLTRVIGVAEAPPISGAEVSTAVPIISVKEVESIMLLNSGETAVLGGLIEDLQSDDDTQVPGLGDLPGLGNLFKKIDQETRRVEYVIFVTAQIITNPSLHGDYSDYQKYLPSDELFHRDNTGSIFGSGRTRNAPRSK